MLARITLAAVAVVSLASLAPAATQVIITGHHNGQLWTVNKVEEAAPYTLTGREDARVQNAQYQNSTRIGNRIVVPSAQR